MQKRRSLKRTKPKKSPLPRVLIICEGSKSEPLYLNSIRTEHRLPTANVQITPSEFGTDPLSIVNFAESLFRNGSREKQIDPRAWDQIYIVFDKDDHHSYAQALSKIVSINNKKKNDLGLVVPVEAINSDPCFEFWLLLHYENIQADIHRNEVYKRLKKHLPKYEKNADDIWAKTKSELNIASERALALDASTEENTPSTAMYKLVIFLISLKNNN